MKNFIGSIVAVSLLVILYGMTLTIHKPKSEYRASNVFNSLVAVESDSGEFVDVDIDELDCMSKNLYFEAGNQKSDSAMIAVGYTVINRVKSKQYPNDVCGVVYQGRKTASGNYVRNKCQFSWVCDGKRDVPSNKYVERKAYAKAKRLALAVLTQKAKNPIGKATMYHANYVNPYWTSAFVKVTKIESHIFYKVRS